MAGDWIKMRTNLDTDPRVIKIAATLGIAELHVVGLLWKVWSWADSHTINGNAMSVTGVTLDRFTSVTGFADALRNVGWLEGRDDALSFPRFAEHNGQTAKNRCETAKRVAKHRNAKPVTDVTQKPLPEKRREEKRREEENNTPLPPLASPSVPVGCTETPAFKPARRGRLTFERVMLPVPKSHLGEPFEPAWNRWLDYLIAKDIVTTEDTARGQLAALCRYGPAEATEIIRRTIEERGWNSLDLPKDKRNGTSRKQSDAYTAEGFAEAGDRPIGS